MTKKKTIICMPLNPALRVGLKEVYEKANLKKKRKIS